MDSAIREGTGGELRLEAPFVIDTKVDIVARGLALDVPYRLTWSCYEGGVEPCGVCGTCIDRAHAFAANGVEDPLLATSGLLGGDQVSQSSNSTKEEHS